MPITAPSARAGRHSARQTRVATIRRTAEQPAAPALTLTVNIPLTDAGLSPPAHKLIEAVRELVEMTGEVAAAPVTVSATPAAGDPGPQDAPAAGHPGPDGAGLEVKLLTASRQVVVDGVDLPLTRLEFDLLLFLADHPRRVFTRAQLLAGVWGYEHTGERTVDVHVRRLRVKLGSQVPAITTVYGVGYRLSDDARIVVLPQD